MIFERTEFELMMKILQENPEILKLQDATKRLEQVNRGVEALLDRLPLKSHLEVARLRELIESQFRLANVYPRSQLPPRVMVFFENARHRAMALRQRYEESIHRGTLRQTSEE